MTENTKTHTDIKSDNWIERFCPAPLKPYAYLARLDRPVGIWLLMIPGWWAIDLAVSAGGYAGRAHILFFLGAVIMRSAGCVINDLWDRELDKKVQRTRSRPLAAETVTLRQAFVFLGILLFLGLFILVQMNTMTVILGFLSLPLIVTYPLMKRFTWWPQAFLGLTFNFGALMGCSAATGSLHWPAFFLYMSCILWTLGYDTIYAHQDMEDDALVGIKSTALKFGERSKCWVSGFYGGSWTLLVLAAVMTTNSPYASLFLIPAGFHLMRQIDQWETKSPASALKTFKSNVNYGWLVVGSLWIFNTIHGFTGLF